MNFSSTAFEEREKETKALKGFLVLSLISSLGLHVGVLASGIGNYFTKIPQTDEEPIEITMIDLPEEPEVEKEQKPEQSPQKVKVQETTEFLTSSTSQPTREAIAKTESQVNPIQPLPRPIIQPKQTVAPEQSIPKLVENSQKPLQPAKLETNLAEKPVDKAPEKPVALSNTNSSNSSSDLRNTLRSIRDSKSSQLVTTSNTSNSTAPGNGTPGGNTSILTGNGTGSSGTAVGSGSGAGNGNGSNNSGSGEQVAAAPTTPKLPSNSGDGRGNSRSNSNGRAACRECSVKYSESARRRGAEGRVSVAVDTDSKGNVTNVRLIGSSGDRELDEAHLRQARNWKLKPSENGREGVQISTEYAMQGSRRHQRVRKQQQEREERQRQREIAASSNNNSAEATPGRRRRRMENAVTGGSDVSATSGRQRRSVESASEQRDKPIISRRRRTNTTEATPVRVRRSGGGNSLANRLQRKRREVTADVRTSGETPQQRMRRRRRDLKPSSPASDSGSRLRNALRRSRPAPAAAPVTQ